MSVWPVSFWTALPKCLHHDLCQQTDIHSETLQSSEFGMFCLLFRGPSVLSENMFLPTQSNDVSQEVSAEMCNSWTCLL